MASAQPQDASSTADNVAHSETEVSATRSHEGDLGLVTVDLDNGDRENLASEEVVRVDHGAVADAGIVLPKRTIQCKSCR